MLSKQLSAEKGKLYAIKGDVAKEDDILSAFSWIEDNLKSPVHVLVNNAAYGSSDTLLRPYKYFLQIDLLCQQVVSVHTHTPTQIRP